jgi:hypothetical protein
MNTKQIALLLITWSLSNPAFAVTCGSVQEDWDNQNWRMTGLEEKMGPVRTAIAAEAGPLQAILIPLQTAANRVMAVYATDDGISSESLQAVTSALGFVEEVLVKRSMREEQSKKLKAAIQQRPSVPLAQQLSELLEHASLSAGDAATLSQLTNAVRLLEKSASNWEASEQEVIQNFLSGNRSLVNGLFTELTNLQQRLNADIASRNKARIKDQERADEANKNVSDAVARQTARQGELDNLISLHAACGAQRTADEHMRANCEAHQPRTPISRREYN